MRAELLALVLLALAPVQGQSLPEPPADLDGPALAAWLREHGCSGCRLEGKYLEGQQLDRVNLSGALITGVELARVSCRECNLEDAEIEDSGLEGASFRGARLGQARFECFTSAALATCQDWDDESAEIDMTDADLTGADVSRLGRLRLDGARVEGATFAVEFPPSLVKARFTEVRLAAAYGSRADPIVFTHEQILALSSHLVAVPRSVVPYRFRLEGGHRPSFDCAMARKEAEEEICRRADLSALDRLLSSTYSRARAGGVTSDALGDQLAWQKRRDDCGSRWYCLSQAMTERLTELLPHLEMIELSAATRFRPLDYRPTLPLSLDGTEVGRKLQRLIGNDSQLLNLSPTERGLITVGGSALGGNGHTCNLDGASFEWDGSRGLYLGLSEDGSADAVKTRGAIALLGDALVFLGGNSYCGARASLGGVYQMEER